MLTRKRFVGYFAMWAAALWAIAVFAHLIIVPAPTSTYTWSTHFSGAARYVTPFVRFDAVHYIDIVSGGYRAGGAQLQAFFPLWPLVLAVASLPLRLFASAHTAAVAAAVVVPVILTLAAFGAVWRWLQAEGLPRRQAQLSLLLVATFPFAFFYLAPYSEALYLLLVAGSLYFMAKRQWWLAAASVALATATRLPAIALVAALAVEWLALHRWRLRALFKAPWLLLTPLGLAAYFVYLQLRQGGWQSYFSSYRLGWPERHFNPDILAPFWRVATQALHTHSISLNNILAIASVLLAPMLLMGGWGRLRPGHRAYCVVAMILPLLTTTLDSTPRYYMLLLPLYPIVAGWLANRPALTWLTVYVSGLLSALLVALFTNGYFIG